MDFMRFLRFDVFITTTIIQVVYVVASLAFIIAILFMPFNGSIGLQLLALVGGLLLIRFYCELIIVIFKIGDNVGNLEYGKQLDDSEPAIED